LVGASYRPTAKPRNVRRNFMTATFETNIKTNKRTLTIIFLTSWLFFTIIYFINRQAINGTEYIFVVAGIVICLYLLWMCFGSIRLIINSDKLIVEKKIFTVTYVRETYNIKNIDNIYKRTNDSANTSWDHGLIVDKNPVVIYFDFHKQQCKIGGGLEAFNADQIISEIKARKKSSA